MLPRYVSTNTTVKPFGTYICEHQPYQRYICHEVSWHNVSLKGKFIEALRNRYLRVSNCKNYQLYRRTRHTVHRCQPVREGCGTKGALHRRDAKRTTDRFHQIYIINQSVYVSA